MNIQHSHTDEFLKFPGATSKIRGASILDSGCGDGFASKRFVELGAKYVLAHDPYALLPDSTTHIHYVKSYIPTSEMFDIAWTHHVIEHVPNPIEYLARIGLQLKKTGELWLGCPNTAKNSVYASGHLHNFTIANLVLCLQRADFDVFNISWLINPGQLRIKIKKGNSPQLPRVMEKLLARDKHFDVNKLPIKLNW